ncbi:MAG: Type 1 glutamine amidotransferase-like domain-containing protein [Defluviitaleaceae bacterium]|nr:Type 1 glutamine amidotransferase-like domain-containing protein [Defluviitaleaceae bacterium]
MYIRYYLSGFDKEYGYRENLSKALLQDIKKANKIIYIPTDFSMKDKTLEYSAGFTSHFAKIGLNFEEVIVLNENMSKNDMHEHIIEADVVYLMGGNPNSQLEILDKYNLENSIRKTNAVVIGLSAGAMCMSKYSIVLPINDKYPIIDIRKGMNLSGISIYPHYNAGGKILDVFEDEKQITKKSDILIAYQKCGDFYLLGDDSVIRDYNGELSFIGNEIILVSSGML